MTATEPELSAKVERLAYRPAEAAEAICVTRWKIYDLIKRGELVAVKANGCTLILRSELERYLSTLPRLETGDVE